MKTTTKLLMILCTMLLMQTIFHETHAQVMMQYIDGNQFYGKSINNKTVWINLNKKQSMGFLILMNNSREYINFSPENISMQELIKNKPKTIKVFSPEEYENKINRKSIFAKVLYGIGVVSRDYNQRNSTNFDATIYETGHRPIGSVEGSFTEPTSNVAEQAYIYNQASIFNSRINMMANDKKSFLLKANTIPENNLYFGKFFFKKIKENQWETKVNFGGDNFNFNFKSNKNKIIEVL